MLFNSLSPIIVGVEVCVRETLLYQAMVSLWKAEPLVPEHNSPTNIFTLQYFSFFSEKKKENTQRQHPQ